MIVIVLAILAQQEVNGPWDHYQNTPERQESPKEGATAINRKTGERLVLRDGVWRPILGPGAHTLIVSDGSAMTRMEYKSGPSCQRAMDAVQRQVAPPQNTKNIIYGPPRISAVCVPR